MSQVAEIAQSGMGGRTYAAVEIGHVLFTTGSTWAGTHLGRMSVCSRHYLFLSKGWVSC